MRIVVFTCAFGETDAVKAPTLVSPDVRYVALTGPQNAPRTWTTARWTGQVWEINPGMTSDSKYDMGCGWELKPHPYGIGYESRDAINLGVNIVMYAVTH